MRKTLNLMIAIVLGTVSVLVAHTVHAAVVEVDVTIKSVDATAREITVTYETRAWQKTIQLVAGPKAEITVNGKPETLNSLKPGQKATVSFEKDLLIANRIDATGSGTTPGREVYRITLQLSEFGDGKFRIEKTSHPPADDFQGTPFKLSRWPHTKATKGQDGMFRLVHDFSDPDDLDVLNGNGKDSGLVLLSEGFQMRNGACFRYGKTLRLPITVMCDIVRHGGEQGVFHLYCQKLGELDCRFWTREPQLDSPFDVSGTWIETRDNGKRDTTTLCETKDIELDHSFEKAFRLPLPNAKFTKPLTLVLSNGMRDRPTTISRLEVRGRLAPMFGLVMQEKQGVLFAGKIIANSLAEKAGFQIGDVISAINGKKPQTRTEAVDMLGHLPIGEEAVFTIQRADKTQELRVIAE